MIKDLVSKLAVSLALKAQTVTADQNGATLDLQDDLGAIVIANLGASGDTLSGSVKIELHLQESDDGSSWAACADEALSAAVTGAQTGTFAVIDDAAEDEAVYKVGYKGHKRYMRACVNMIGTHTNGTPISMSYATMPCKLPA